MPTTLKDARPGERLRDACGCIWTREAEGATKQPLSVMGISAGEPLHFPERFLSDVDLDFGPFTPAEPQTIRGTVAGEG